MRMGELSETMKATSPPEDLTSQQDILTGINIVRTLKQGMLSVVPLLTDMLDIWEERTSHDLTLYPAMEKLSSNELERTYLLLKRDINQGTQPEVDQDHELSTTTRLDVRAHSDNQLLGISAEVDETNTMLDRSLQSVHTTADYNRGKTSRGLWRKIFKHSVRP